MPIISFYSQNDLEPRLQSNFFIGWITISSVLYFFWNVLWYLSDLKSRYQKWLVFLVPAGILILMYIILNLLNVPIRWNYFVRGFFVWVLFSIIQYALRTQTNIAKLKLEKEKLQTENYKAQLTALHARIDPHFLFNSLNTLRSMVRQQHSNSEEFIISLSDFYRQTLKYKEDTTIQLSKELDVLQSYLFVMESRNENAISINLDINKELYQMHLPTLALQIIVENCFKHNSMSTQDPLKISIRSTKDHYIQICNNMQPKFGEIDKSGYGLKLLRKRYALMEVEEGVIINENLDSFCVKLKLIGK